MVLYQFGLNNCYENFKEVDRISEEERELGVEDDTHAGTDPLTAEDAESGFMDTIKIDNVSWQYMNSQDKVLNGVSMEIHKGESIALIGPSGAGKTTLADIIMGLLKPQSGTVWMDDRDIFLIPHTWYKQIGYVPQSVYLIDDTVRSNIAFGLPKEMISDERVWSALEQAQFKSFVEELPDGLDTIVGERGVKFSGGQRQRIGIARALAVNPRFIVCDEPVSALDVSIQAQVVNMFEDLREKLGVAYLFIAHDLLVVHHISDRIAVMYLGRIVEIADANELNNNPMHPYSISLLSAVPIPDPKIARSKKRIIPEGEIPSPLHKPSGCAFRTRCPYATEKCSQECPELTDRGDGHLVACFNK